MSFEATPHMMGIWANIHAYKLILNIKFVGYHQVFADMNVGLMILLFSTRIEG
jgi:hypothetical protein